MLRAHKLVHPFPLKPIYADMKHHQNIFNILKYLKATYRMPRKVDGVYDQGNYLEMSTSST